MSDKNTHQDNTPYMSPVVRYWVGYWEIDGKPVSRKEARGGFHYRAIWRMLEITEDLIVGALKTLMHPKP